MSKIAKTTFRLLDILVILVMTFGQPMSAFAAVWTDQQDYSPGSVVTINGDNSDGAGYLPQETVHVDVAGPNGYVSSCEGSADDNGAWSCQVTLWPGLEAVGSYTYTATGLSSGVTETGRFTDAAGSYSIKWYAADPAVNRAPYLPTYTKVKPNQMACPTPSGGTGRAADPMPNAVGYGPTFISSDLDAVTSLAPKDLALGQIVPFELEITVSGSTAPENGVISVTPYWLTKVTNGADFGFDPSYGVYCAFVDTADPGTVDPGGNAKVNSWTSGTVNPGTSNEQIQGTLQISGLNDGDNVIVEIWVVLKSSIAQGIGGNVQTGLADARTASGTKINIGNQTVPLLQVGSFFTATADLSVTKSDSPDPVVQGQTLTYSLVVTNNSTDTVANGIVVTDTLDPNVSFVSGSWSGGTCTASAGVVTCNVGSLSPLGSTTITIVTTVSATAPVNNTTGSDPVGGTCTVGSGFDLCNTVSLTAITSDPTTANNSDSEPTNVLSSFVPAPALSLLKQISTSASGPWSSSITVAGGSSVYYQFTITNTGNVALDPISVSDPTLSGEENCVWTPAAPLAPAGSSSCVIGPFTAATLAGTYPNTATASGGYGGSTYNSGPSSAEYVVSAAPSLSLVKSATPATYSTVGDVISYSYLVTNNGNVKLAGPVTVDDDKASDEACPDVATVGNLDGFLDPGESITCTASYTITQTDLDNGSVTNVASASAGGTTSPTDTETVTADQTPNLTVTKEATETTYSAVGDVIHYSILVTNDGNVTLHNVTVSDPNADNLTCTPGNPVADLAPGDTINCTAEHTIVQADLDAGHFGNAACVDDGEGGAAEACDTVDTPGTQNPHLTVTKEATETTYSAVGDVIHYSILVTNDGNVTLHNVTVSDPNADNLTCTPGNPVADLAPGDTINCTASHTIVQADLDAGHFGNAACVDDGEGGAAEACDTVDTPGTQNPHLTVTKEATETTYSAVGDVIHYSIVVTNDGNVTLHNVTVSDPNADNLTCTPGNPVTDLAPGDTINCTASHTIVQADLDAGHFGNAACVDDGEGGAAEACDTVDTPGTQNPHLTVTKEATETTYSAVGDVIHYSIVVTNDGNVTLHNVTVSDPNADNLTCTPGNPVTDLAPGDTINCTAEHTIVQADLDAGHFGNAACVDDGEGGAAEACDTVDTPGTQNPAIRLTKSATLQLGQNGTLEAGDTVLYGFVIQNIGNVTLTGVDLDDALLGYTDVVCGQTTLAPGASTNCTATYTLTQADIDAGSVTNLANACGTPPTGSDVCDVDSTSTPLAQYPAIQLTKSATLQLGQNGTLEAGDTVLYGFVIQNIGNVTLTGVDLDDSLLGYTDVTCGQTTLVPGASTNCTASYTLLQADIDAGSVTNLANACGTPPTGPDVCDTDSTSTPLAQNPAIQLTKSATLQLGQNGTLEAGDTVLYGFVITNIGNVTLTGVDLDDALLGYTDVVCGQTTLAPGASTNCTASYTLLQADIDAGSVTNFANACGTPPTGSDVCDVDVTTTPLPQRPSLSIVKDTLGSTGDWGDGVFVVFNENVSWRYIVTNTGNVTLTNVAVTDNKLASSAIDCGGGSNIIASLAPGASVTCTAGPVVNTVAIGTTYNNIGTASTTFGSTPVSATDPSSYTSRPFGLLMTNTELCSLPNDQFRLLFTPDQGKGYKLNATNPGQFYYNMFYVGAGNETVSLTLPYPWVTQGNVPIHIYADVAFTTNSGGQTCLTPSGLLPNPTQTYVTLQSYGQQAFGQTTTVQVNIPATGSPNGFLYINIHLDYGLKDTTYWTKGALNQAIQTIPSGVTYPTYPTINDLTPYTFLDGKGSTTTITSTNVFKKNPGIGGLVTYSGGGAVVNTSVEIKLGTKVMATVKTDADGWYMWSYKWTGKAVTFTVKLLNYYPAVATKSATLKANGFVQVNFEVP